MVRPGASTSGVAPTAVALVGLALTGMMLPNDHATSVFSVAAIGVGLALAIATGMEGAAGIRNLMRVDVLILWVLYGLTFFEFLFSQPRVDGMVTALSARNGTFAALLGFAGILIGRHLVPRRRSSERIATVIDVRPSDIFLIFVLATSLGYLHIFLAVDFDIVEAVRQMSLPRFAQSWSRGRLGDVQALLYELGALIYLIPPVAGYIYAHRWQYSFMQKAVVTAVLVFTLYYGFASGTRNVLATYVITLVGSYLLTQPRLKASHLVAIGVPVAVLLMAAMIYMLEFRTGGLGKFSFAEESVESVFIDLNMVNVSLLTELFPDAHEFLGLEIPFNALIRPIPRALWPGKPEGLSTSIEDALGAGPGLTVSCTFIGEAFMSGGFLAVMLFGIAFGVGAELWNRVGRDMQPQLAQLLYASGFLCAALAMRSMLSMVPFMLPTAALWAYSRLWFPRSSAHRPKST
jgi:oligosaccharide repeat unit polymerase